MLTGTMPNLSRDEATNLIRSAGGKVTGSVSKKTDYLVAGDSPGTKLAKAEEVGTEILDEEGCGRCSVEERRWSGYGRPACVSRRRRRR